VKLLRRNRRGPIKRERVKTKLPPKKLALKKLPLKKTPLKKRQEQKSVPVRLPLVRRQRATRGKRPSRNRAAMDLQYGKK
ncbi:MAG: hypothetical protein ACKOUR_13450, partial [Planctomycetota bacterium]